MTLGKLFNLKKWLTVPDAAKHLSIVCGEEVTEADVLCLALDGHLKLSVNFVNHAKARKGKIVPEDEAPTFIGFLSGKELILGIDLGTGEVIVLDDDIVTLEGVWDLSMIGCERIDIEHTYHRLTGGPTVDLVGIRGTFVEKRDGLICQLQEHFEKNVFKAGSEKDNYYPAGGLPQDSVLVVRTDALREFEQSVNGASEKIDKPLLTTERNTLLSIIAALCDYSDIKYQERGAAGQIAKMTSEIKSIITDDTVRKVLKQIPDALKPA